MVYIRGTTPDGGPGMVFNFKDQHDNIALHFNPRFNESCVVRNSCIGGSWGTEERYGGLPLHPNENYTAAIIFQNNGYEIAINGIHFTYYEYRIPRQDIKQMTIEVNPETRIENK